MAYIKRKTFRPKYGKFRKYSKYSKTSRTHLHVKSYKKIPYKHSESLRTERKEVYGVNKLARDIKRVNREAQRLRIQFKNMHKKYGRSVTKPRFHTAKRYHIR